MSKYQLPDRLFSLISPRIREFRHLDPAISILQQLLRPTSEQAANRMAVQLEMLLEFLRNEGFSEKLYASGHQFPANLSWHSTDLNYVRQIAEDLLSRLSVRRKIVDLKGFLPYTGLPDHTDGASGVGFTPPKEPKAISPPEPDDSRLQATWENKQKIWENAFLASLTERLYGSASFRFLGLLLAAAVLLAGTGTFFIGNQGMKLSEKLESAADRADKSIQDQAARAKAAIKTQQESLETARTAIADNTRQFNEKVVSAQREVDQAILAFRNDAGDLRKKTIDQLIEIVRSDLDNQTSRLRVDIANYATSRKNDIGDDATSRKNGIAEYTTSLTSDIAAIPVAKLRTDVETALRQLPDLQEKTKRVAEAAAHAENVAGQLVTAVVLLDGARTNSQAAAGHAQAAETAAGEIERLRKRGVETLKPNKKELLGLHQALGVTRERLRAAQDGITNYEKEAADIKNLQQRIGDLKTATSNVDGSVALVGSLQRQARQLCEDLQRLRPRRTESTLSKDEWRLIKPNLTSRGLKVRAIEGKPGPLAIGNAKPKKAGV